MHHEGKHDMTQRDTAEGYDFEDVGIDETAIGGGGIDRDWYTTSLCTCTERECVCDLEVVESGRWAPYDAMDIPF